MHKCEAGQPVSHFKFSDPLWNTITNEYELICPLGVGSFGQVMRARHISSGVHVAIKLMKNLFDSNYSSKKLVSEIQIMRQMTSIQENCFTTKIYDVITAEFDPLNEDELTHLFIVMEYVDSDLQKLMKYSS